MGGMASPFRLLGAGGAPSGRDVARGVGRRCAARVETAILAGGPAVSTVSLLPATGSVHERLADRRNFTTSAQLKDHEARSPR